MSYIVRDALSRRLFLAIAAAAAVRQDLERDLPGTLRAGAKMG
jgi:hypothetical protein